MDRTGNVFDTTSTSVEIVPDAQPYWSQTAYATQTPPQDVQPQASEPSVFDQPMVSFNTETTTTSTTQTQTTTSLPTPPPSRSQRVLGIVLILAVIVFFGWLISRHRPTDYQSCTELIGSKTAEGRCTTFYNQVFVNWTGTGFDTEQPQVTDGSTAPDSAQPMQPAEYAQPSATPTQTTKGGVTVSATVPPKPTQAPTSAPVNTTSTTTTVPTDWIRHRYPQQGLILYAPRSYQSGDAVRNLDTLITTIKLWTSSINNPEIVITIQPASQVDQNTRNQAANTTIADVPAHKAVNGNQTVYTWQKNDQWYTATVITSTTNDQIIQSLQY